jgi:predicted DCC family thiol-disulfide oxidoreductase YuxK
MSGSTCANPVLLYDGVCGLCNNIVRTILKHDRRGSLRFAALQGEFAGRVKARHPDLVNIDSIVFVEYSDTCSERVFVRSEASLRVASYLGGFWNLLLIFRLVPKKTRDFLYNFLASRRYRLFGRHDICMLPPAGAKTRFLD